MTNINAINAAAASMITIPMIISEYTDSDFQTRLKRLQRRAVKLGLPAPQAELTRVEDQKRRSEMGSTYYIRLFHYELTHPTVKIADWEVIGKLEAQGNDANIVKMGVEDVPRAKMLSFRSGSQCEHCNTKRHRTTTVVLRHTTTGDIKRVGSTCLKDFTGAHDAAALFAAKIFGFCDEESFRVGGGPLRLGHDDVLFVVHCLIKENGWLSRGKARDMDGHATADQAWDLALARANNTGSPSMKAARRELLTVTNLKEVKAEITAAITWGQAIPADVSNDYLYNLRTALQGESVTEKELGLVASLLPAYRRHIQRTRRDQMAKQDDAGHFGAPGDKIGRKCTKKDRDAGKASHPAHQVTITRCVCTEGMYGPKTVIGMAGADGHAFVWFKSGYADFKVGATHTMIATIKSHGDFRGVSQTIVQRAALS